MDNGDYQVIDGMERLYLVQDHNLFIRPALKGEMKLNTLQYLQKLQLLFSLTVWSLN